MRVLRSVGFALLFYGGTVGFVLAALLAMSLSRLALMRIVAGWSRYFRWLCRHVLAIRDRFEGRWAEGSVLYAIKHESFYETLSIASLLDAPAVFAKRELTDLPLWGRTARAYGIVPVDREGGAATLRAMVAAAREALGHGRALVIYPEGTRVAHGVTPPLQSGFAGLYKLLGVPVVPVAVDSGPLFRSFWKHPGVVTWRIGEAIPPGRPRAEVEEAVHRAINDLNNSAVAL